MGNTHPLLYMKVTRGRVVDKEFQELHPHTHSIKFNFFKGLPWRSSGWDLALSLPWLRVQSLVGELRSRKRCGAAKKKKVNSLKTWKVAVTTALLFISPR